MPIGSYTNNIYEFFDNNMNAIGINKKKLFNEKNISIGNEVIIEIPIELNEFEKKNINLIMGKNTERYFEEKSVEKEIEKVEEYWNEKTGIIKVKTPSEKINIYMNKWLIYQTITSRLFGNGLI